MKLKKIYKIEQLFIYIFMFVIKTHTYVPSNGFVECHLHHL